MSALRFALPRRHLATAGPSASILHRAQPPRIARTALRSLSPYLNHASDRRSFGAWSLIEATTGTLQTMHGVGLPWFLAIPILAVGINFTFVAPMLIMNRRRNNKRVRLIPLQRAWIRQAQIVEAQSLRAPVTLEVALQSLSKQATAEYKRLLGKFGLQRWKDFLVMPASASIYIVASQALISMCGSYRSNLLFGDAAADTLLEPSLQWGGVVFFSDLTAIGPLMGLPLMCTIIALLNNGVLSRTKLRQIMSSGNEPPGTISSTRIQRVILLSSFAPLAAGMYLPNCMMLYVAGSMSASGLIRQIVNRTNPAPAMPLPPVTEDYHDTSKFLMDERGKYTPGRKKM